MTILSILLCIALFSFLACLSKYLEESKKYESLKKRYDELHSEKFTFIENANRMKREMEYKEAHLEEYRETEKRLNKQIENQAKIVLSLQEENMKLEKQTRQLTSISKEQEIIKKRKLSKPKAKK